MRYFRKSIPLVWIDLRTVKNPFPRMDVHSLKMDDDHEKNLNMVLELFSSSWFNSTNHIVTF